MKAAVAAGLLSLFLLAPAIASEQSANSAKSRKKIDGHITLYGEIDELSYMSSSAGVKLVGKGPPYSVAKVSLGSAAAYSGIREGDKVLHARLDDNNLVLTIERKGKTYEASVATDVHGLKSEFEKRKIKWSLGEGALDKDLTDLSRYEITVLLDRSASMSDNHAGCPGDLSKWLWCKHQIDNFYLATSRVLEGGFNLVTFNHSFQEWNGVTLWDLKQLYGRIAPEGKDKDIATPLNAVISDYLYKRKHDKTSKPCIIVVLTDGMENVGQPLETVLIEASRKVPHPGDVQVVFMQVGESIFADELFEDLDRNLVAKGASYHVARYKPFSELRNRGVLWELLSTISDALHRRQPGGL